MNIFDGIFISYIQNISGRSFPYREGGTILKGKNERKVL